MEKPRLPLAVSVLLSVSSLSPATLAYAETQNWLVGTWTLVSATQDENGQTKDYIGPHPLGQVTFGADGRFSNILMRSDLRKFQSGNRANGTAEENAEVVRGSIAYFGTYTLTDDRLTMHLEGSTFPNWTGTDQVRNVRLSGNQLTWENAGPSAGGAPLKQVYTRVK